jgi:hypothetical protein
MVRTENQLAEFEPGESALDVAAAQSRAIAPDSDDFVITELRDRFDRILEAGCKTTADLAVNPRTLNGSVSVGSEKMDIDCLGKFGTECGKI